MSDRITQRELENYLWARQSFCGASSTLGTTRGSTSSRWSSWKRISDVYDEEHAAAMRDYGDEVLADLQRTIASHPLLDATGTTSPVTRRHRLNHPQRDARHRVRQSRHLPRRLRRWRLGQQEPAARPDPQRPLIEHFSTKVLSIANLPEDELGNGYEYLIKKFADDSGIPRRSSTPTALFVHLMTLMLEPRPGRLSTIPPAVPAACSSLRLPRSSVRASGAACVCTVRKLNYGTSAIAHEPLLARHHRRTHRSRRHLGPARATHEAACGPSTSSWQTRPTRSRLGTETPSRGILRTQHLGCPTPGTRRLRLLPAHRQESSTRKPAVPRSSPHGVPIPARRGSPPRGTGEVRPRRVCTGLGRGLVLQLANAVHRRYSPEQEADRTTRQGPFHQRRKGLRREQAQSFLRESHQQKKSSPPTVPSRAKRASLQGHHRPDRRQGYSLAIPYAPAPGQMKVI